MNPDTDKMLNTYIRVAGVAALSILTLFLFVSTINAAKTYTTIGDDQMNMKTINVRGTADVNATPDVRVVSVSIIGKGKNEAEANSAAGAKSQKVADYLKSKGIATADINNQNYGTYPTYSTEANCPKYAPSAAVAPSMPGMTSPTIIQVNCGSNSVITGYETNQTITVKLRGDKMTTSGQFVTDIAALGATAQTGEATIDNPDTVRAQARDAAIMNARMDAQKLAKSLGVHLGKVISYNEESGGYYPMYDRAMNASGSMKAESAPVIPTGSQKVTVSVNVTYSIE